VLVSLNADDSTNRVFIIGDGIRICYATDLEHGLLLLFAVIPFNSVYELRAKVKLFQVVRTLQYHSPVFFFHVHLLFS